MAVPKGTGHQELDEEVNGFLNGAPRGLKNFA